MKRFLLLFTLFPSFSFAAQSCPNIFLDNTVPVSQNPVTLLCNEDYAVGFSEEKKEPVFSAEHLTRESVIRAKNLHDKTTEFRLDNRLPTTHQATLDDYQLAGITHGILASKEDMPSKASQDSTLLITNIVPQNAKMKTSQWEKLEQKIRTQARKDGELYVVTGPAYLGDAGEVGTNKLKIPSHLWKAVYDVKTKDSHAVICENIVDSHCKEEPVAELERDIGLKIFSED